MRALLKDATHRQFDIGAHPGSCAMRDITFLPIQYRVPGFGFVLSDYFFSSFLTCIVRGKICQFQLIRPAVTPEPVATRAWFWIQSPQRLSFVNLWNEWWVRWYGASGVSSRALPCVTSEGRLSSYRTSDTGENGSGVFSPLCLLVYTHIKLWLPTSGQRWS